MTDTDFIARASAELKKQVEREMLVSDPVKEKAVALLCGEVPMPRPSVPATLAELETPPC